MKLFKTRTNLLWHWITGVFLLTSFASCGVINADDGIPIDGKIVFYSNRTEGKWGLHIYDGKSLRFLVADWSYPQWMDNGKEILAANGGTSVVVLDSLSGKELKRYELGLKVINPKLLNDHTGFVFFSDSPLLNERGERVGGDIPNLYLFKFDAETIQNITNNNLVGTIVDFDISPRGAWLAYKWREGLLKEGHPSQVIILNLEMEDKIILEDKITSIGWSPEGIELYYAKATKQGEPRKGIEPIVGLFSYNIETRESKLLYVSFKGSSFTFSPDGAKLLLASRMSPMVIFNLETKEYQEVLKPVRGRNINDGHADWIA